MISRPGRLKCTWNGKSRTKVYVEEADACIDEVTLSTVPSVGFRDRRHYEQLYQEQEASDNSQGLGESQHPPESDVPTTAATYTPLSITDNIEQVPALRTGQQTVDDLGTISRSPGNDSRAFATFPRPTRNIES